MDFNVLKNKNIIKIRQKQNFEYFRRILVHTHVIDNGRTV